MEQKKKLLALLLIIIIPGIAAEIIVFLGPILPELDEWYYKQIQIILQSLIIETPSSSFYILEDQIFYIFPYCNFFNLIAHTLALCGVLLFFVSKGKDILIIEFYLLFVFFNSIIQLLIETTINFHFVYEGYFDKYELITTIISFITTFMWIVISGKGWEIIQNIKTESLEHSNTPINDYANKNEASKTLRIVAGFIDFFILSYIIGFFLSKLAYLYDLTGYYQFYRNKSTGIILISSLLIISYILYFVLFEKLFGKTLGKLLTNTSIIYIGKDKPTFQTYLKRTLWRIISPFTLFRQGVARHDKFCSTVVVKNQVEKRNLPMYIVFIVILISSSIFSVNHYKSKAEFLLDYNLRIRISDAVAKFENQFNSLSVNDYLYLTDIFSSFSNEDANDVICLKVEDITDDSISFWSIPLVKYYERRSLKTLDQEYLCCKEKYKTIKLSKSELKAALNETSFYSYDESTDLTKGVNLDGYSNLFVITKISSRDEPELELDPPSSYSYSSQQCEVQVENKGFELDLIEINNIIGNIEWKVDLPLRICQDLDVDSTDSDIKTTYYTLIGENINRNKKYKSELVFKKENGELIKYYLEHGRAWSIKQVIGN